MNSARISANKIATANKDFRNLKDSRDWGKFDGSRERRPQEPPGIQLEIRNVELHAIVQSGTKLVPTTSNLKNGSTLN